MTRATDRGFKVGKQYTISTEGHHTFTVGDVVEFITDDDSSSPYFRRVCDNRTSYVNLERMDPNEAVEAPAGCKKEVTYSVEVNSDNSNIFVRKQLSYDQIKRIIDIVGE